MAIMDPTTNPITTTAANDTYFAAWVSDQIIDETRAYNVCRPFFKYAGRQASNVYNWPTQDDPGVGATYTEGTGLANTAITTDVKAATALAYGQMFTITDELMEQTLIDAMGHFTAILGRACAEYMETVMTALLDDFASTSGTAATATTYATLLAAANALEQRDMVGTYVTVLDPTAIGNIRTDLGTSAAAFLGGPGSPVPGTQDATLAGYAFHLAGADVYQTSLVTTTGGATFLVDHALGLYEMRPVRVETQRVIALPGTEIVATGRAGVIEIVDLAGQTILTN